MCGIAGILDKGSSKSNGALTHHLRQMLNKMQHRGPDDRGEETIIQSNSISMYLGHQRLSVIEPGPGGHQPMSNDDSTIWISTNSEIYNYLELKKDLQLNYNFKSKSDTEVLLRAYEAWGIDCLKKLRGMFAFGIWDKPNNQLVLARDRLGIKPLYYYYDKNIFLFSSELRSILATNLVKKELSKSGLFQYLSYGRLDSTQTITKSIYELPPGHFLIADKNGIKITKYWEPLKNKNIFNPSLSLTEQIETTLEDAVCMRLVSDVPLGAFLSGGIDSSAIVGIMAGNNSKQINTLSVTFNEKIYDESKYSNLIANKYKTNHTEINLSENSLIDILPSALKAMDQPTVDGINTYIISLAAKQNGLTVALSGLGGDELFAGYDSFNIISILNKLYKTLNTLPLNLRKVIGNIFSTLIVDPNKKTKLIHLINGKINSSHVYFLIRTLFCDEGLTTLFSDQSLKEAEVLKNIEKTQNLIDLKKNLSLTELTSYLELTQYTAPTLLRDTDMMSMANGLEVRVPLLDHKLVELMFSVPSKIIIKQNIKKNLLIKSLKKKLPVSIINRKKMGFVLPFEYWMRGKMKSEIESVLMTPSQKLSGYISEAGIKKIWSDFLDNRCSWSRPWSLYVLKNWVENNY